MNKLLQLPNTNVLRILSIMIFVCVSGCTTTIYDKHKELMNANPSRVHYATAVPFYGSGDKSSAYRSACIHYGSYPSYQRKAEYPYDWFSAYGGGSQEAVESYVIEGCENRYTNQTCIIVLYNNTERCSATFDNAYARAQLKNNQKQEREKQVLEEKGRRKAEEISQTCIAFGFKPNSTELSRCILEMHNSLAQIEAIRSASNQQTESIEAANAEAKKLREFEQSMRLLQIGAGMITPQEKRLTTTCTFDAITQRMKCR